MKLWFNLELYKSKFNSSFSSSSLAKLVNVCYSLSLWLPNGPRLFRFESYGLLIDLLWVQLPILLSLSILHPRINASLSLQERFVSSSQYIFWNFICSFFVEQHKVRYRVLSNTGLGAFLISLFLLYYKILYTTTFPEINLISAACFQLSISFCKTSMCLSRQ